MVCRCSLRLQLFGPLAAQLQALGDTELRHMARILAALLLLWHAAPPLGAQGAARSDGGDSLPVGSFLSGCVSGWGPVHLPPNVALQPTAWTASGCVPESLPTHSSGVSLG